MGSFFKGKIFLFRKTGLKITFKHHLSEMYLLLEKDHPLSVNYAKRQLSFPLIYRVIEERRWQMCKNMITLSTVTDPKMILLAQFVYKTWSRLAQLLSYLHIFSLKSFLLMVLVFATKINCLDYIARLITIRYMYIC